MKNPAYLNKIRLISNFAWTLIKDHGYTRSEAYKLSWKVYKLRTKLSNGTTEFSFIKKDGSVRKAVGTTNIGIMPKDASMFKGKEIAINPMQIRYYDVESQGWRSFLAGNLI